MDLRETFHWMTLGSLQGHVTTERVVQNQVNEKTDSLSKTLN